ncbi:MAG: PD-(D/E)XK nuclease family protein, partial [Balneolaceae bacterium]|nr:PD-(D/E)XK nuclease family protein [Balneolaceae bacterium]
ARKYSRKESLLAGPFISSFSSLARDQKEEMDAAHELYLDDFWEEIHGNGESTGKGKEEEESEISSIGQDPVKLDYFHFPRGPKPGTAIHHIFEAINFSDPDNLPEIATQFLNKQGISEKWAAIASDMVGTALDTPLVEGEPSFKLSSLSPRQMIAEMEFYFPNKGAALDELLHIIREPEMVPEMTIRKSDSGFLKGFIDLTFLYQDRFYILDYKTNHLGDTLSDYSENSLAREMQDALYDLQYHLYVLAVHRHLKKTVGGYDYDNHFGGVFYLFLRGLNSEGREGIFYDCPPRETIEALDDYFKIETIHE